MVKISRETPPETSLSDPDLIEACLKGKSEAWEALIRRYQNLIYSVPMQYHFSMQDAADVFQGVCLILLEKLKTLRKLDSLSSWLYVTTKRMCWKISRKRDLEIPFADNPDSISVDPQEDRVVLQYQLKRALEELPPKCRKLLTALYYSDPPLSYDEVSAKLDIPFGSIGPTRARCLERLRKQMNKD
jgi:RNA polymerase sigma factor (sigma-70 family)